MTQVKNTLALVLTILAAAPSFAENLNCREKHSFRGAQLFINRDGYIGFNGTYIDLQAPWFRGTGFDSVSNLTGRASDKLAPNRLILNLSPKEACTLNNNSLKQDFACHVPSARLDVTGSTSEQVNDGSAVQLEQTTKSFRVIADVDLNAQIQEISATERNIQLQAVITNPKTGKQIKLSEQMSCTVEK